MKWITREKVKVDRVACPWLVRRVVDRDAVFEFLPKETDWSRITEGILFDVPGCDLGHHGEDVSLPSDYWRPSYALQIQTPRIRTRPGRDSDGSRTGSALWG